MVRVSPTDLLGALAGFNAAATETQSALVARFEKWIGCNVSDTAHALRSETITLMGDLVLEYGPVLKLKESPERRWPQSTTWLRIPTEIGVAHALVKNVEEVDNELRFLVDSSPTLAEGYTGTLLSVESQLQIPDIVIGISRVEPYRHPTDRSQSRPGKLKLGCYVGALQQSYARFTVLTRHTIFEAILPPEFNGGEGLGNLEPVTPVVPVGPRSKLTAAE